MNRGGGNGHLGIVSQRIKHLQRRIERLPKRFLDGSKTVLTIFNICDNKLKSP